MEDKLTGINQRDGRRYNCGVSTVMMVNDKHPLPGFDADVMRILSHTGAGLSLSGAACGAVVGMATALGLAKGTDGTEPQEEFPKINGENMMAARAIVNEFREKFGGINCKDLTGLDLSVDEELGKFGGYVADMKEKANGVHPCDAYLDWAAQRVVKHLKT